MNPWLTVDGRILCQRCGVKGDLHKGDDGMCPPTTAWGVARPFPKLTQAKDPDAAIDKYWKASKGTKYTPMKTSSITHQGAVYTSASISQQQANEMEKVLDGADLVGMVDTLANICRGKAEHIEGNYGTDDAANAWRKAADILTRAGDKLPKYEGIVGR